MKKLVVFSLAVVAVCAVNAASFAWNASTANGTDGSGNVLTSASDAATFVLVYLGNGESASYDNAVVVQTGTWSIGSSGKSGNTAKVSGTYTGTGAEGWANGNVYGVMVQDDQGGLHQVAGTSTYTVTGYSGDTWSGSTFNFTSASTYVADKASYPAGGAIPEPTSGLLLLVGAGMLALRRKQK